MYNYENELAGMYFWLETSSMGTEMYYWDLEHRPFMMADMVPGPSGPHLAQESRAALVGGRYVCFETMLTEDAQKEPALFDLESGTFNELNVASGTQKATRPKHIQALGDELCLMSVETADFYQSDIGREFFTLNVSDPASGLELVSDFTPGTDSGTDTIAPNSASLVAGYGWIAGSDGSGISVAYFEPDAAGNVSISYALIAGITLGASVELWNGGEAAVATTYGIGGGGVMTGVTFVDQNGTITQQTVLGNMSGANFAVPRLGTAEDGSPIAFGVPMSMGGDPVDTDGLVWDLNTGFVVQNLGFVPAGADLELLQDGSMCYYGSGSDGEVKIGCKFPNSTELVQFADLPKPSDDSTISDIYIG